MRSRSPWQMRWQSSWATINPPRNRVEPTKVLDRICRDACAISAGCSNEDGSVCQRPAFSFQVRLIQAAEPGSLRGDEPRPASLRGRLEVSQPETWWSGRRRLSRFHLRDRVLLSSAFRNRFGRGCRRCGPRWP